MLKNHDALGRPFPEAELPFEDCNVTDRAETWLTFLNVHRYASSVYLHDLTLDTHASPDYTRRHLYALRKARFIRYPAQQMETADARSNFYVYELAPRGIEYLRDNGLYVDAVWPTGHWVHAYMTSCITASIDIMARRNGFRYIPGHEITSRAQTTIGTKIGKSQLIPDQFFGLEYPDRTYRFFCVEADRGTEPTTAKNSRKTHRSTIRLYREFIGQKLYKDHYQLNAGLLLLAVFSRSSKLEAFNAELAKQSGGRNSYILSQHIQGFDYRLKPPELLTYLFDKPYQRVGNDKFYINN